MFGVYHLAPRKMERRKQQRVVATLAAGTGVLASMAVMVLAVLSSVVAVEGSPVRPRTRGLSLVAQMHVIYIFD